MYTLHHCNIFSLKCPTTHWNRAPKFKSAFFTSSKLWKLSNGFVLRLYHISFNVNLASQATKPFPQSCGAKYFSQQSPFIFLAQKSLYLANTFLGPAPRGVAALVSVSDDKIQITMLIPGRSALSRRGSMSIQNLNFLKVSYPGTPCILSSSSSSTYIIYREVCLTFISLLKNIVNLFKWLIASGFKIPFYLWDGQYRRANRFLIAFWLKSGKIKQSVLGNCCRLENFAWNTILWPALINLLSVWIARSNR